MRKFFIAVAFVVSLLVMACNDGTKTAEPSKESPAAENKTAQPANDTSLIELTANDQLKFDKIELRVKANAPVKLTLKNIGTMPKESMGHNFVLLKDGTDLASFAAEAVSAPEHIPANNAALITHTKLLGPGESDTIEFTVPAGSYTYICSFPGHYMTMTGVLTAE
jgi:azurin